jgi:hypothetical protein
MERVFNPSHTLRLVASPARPAGVMRDTATGWRQISLTRIQPTGASDWQLLRTTFQARDVCYETGCHCSDWHCCSFLSTEKSESPVTNKLRLRFSEKLHQVLSICSRRRIPQIAIRLLNNKLCRWSWRPYCLPLLQGSSQSDNNWPQRNWERRSIYHRV